MKLIISNEQPSSPLQRMIPNDILGRILFGGYLDNTIRQLSTMRSVCPQFISLARTFCTSLDARPSICRKEATRRQHYQVGNIFIQQFPSLVEVNFSFIKDFDNHCMLKLFSLRDKLRVLKLRDTSVADLGVEDFLGCHNNMSMVSKPYPLEVLDLSKTNMKCRDFIGKRAMEAIVVS
jgi:hypothetical protein